MRRCRWLDVCYVNLLVPKRTSIRLYAKFGTGVMASVCLPPNHELIKHLGSGAYSRVLLTTCVQEDVADRSRKRKRGYQARYAVKLMPLGDKEEDSEMMRRVWTREVVHMSRAHAAHPDLFVKLIQVVDECATAKQVGMVLEYMPGGTLDQKDYQLCPRREFIKDCRGLLQGLEALNRLGIVHRDIKPQNILLDTQGFPKIADFGLATVVGENLPAGCRLTEYVVTRWYRSPELCLCDAGAAGKYGTAVDVWAMALVFLEMIQRRAIVRGTSGRDQLLQTFELFGGPTAEEVLSLRSMAPKWRSPQPTAWQDTIACRLGRITDMLGDHINTDGITAKMILGMLMYCPFERSTAEGALRVLGSLQQ